MPKSVLIYETQGSEFAKSAGKWQDQWVKAEWKYTKGEQRTAVGMKPRLDFVGYIKIVGEACITAGQGGQLLFLVGHGADISTLMQKPGHVLGAEQALSVGMMDLAPCTKNGSAKKCDFRMQTDEVFYDYAPQSSVARVISPLETDLRNFDGAGRAQKEAIKHRFMDYIKYRLVGHCAQGRGLKQVVLLNCNVGNATDFMQKVANDWQLPVVAFIRRLESREEPTTDFVRMYGFGDAFDSASNTIEARYNYPQMYARTFKPKGPASLPINYILDWLKPKIGTAQSGKPVGRTPAKVGAH